MVLVKRFIMFSFIKQILLITHQSGALKGDKKSKKGVSKSFKDSKIACKQE